MAEAKTWKVGNPSDPTVNMGALISKEHLEKVRLHGVYMISSHLLEGYERWFQRCMERTVSSPRLTLRDDDPKPLQGIFLISFLLPVAWYYVISLEKLAP